MNLRPYQKTFLNLVFVLASFVTFFASPQVAAAGNMATSGIGKAVPYASGTNHYVRPGTAQGAGEALLDSNFTKCGQDCLYLKANENVTIQMDYLLKKVTYLMDQNNSESSKRQLLAGFCGKPGGVDEDIHDCVERYEKVNKFLILKARGSLSKHEIAIGSLQCTQFDQSGKCMSAPIEAPVIQMGRDSMGHAQEDLLPHMHHISKSSEIALQASHQAAARVQRVTDNHQWAEQLNTSLEPKLEDFIQFRRILRNPSQPSEGSIEVPVTSGNGKLVHDVAAFQAAHDEWSGIAGGAAKAQAAQTQTATQSSATAQSGKNPNVPLKGLRATIHGTTEGQSIHKVLEQNQRQFQTTFAPGVSQSNVQTDDQYVSRKLYNEARGESIDALNDFVKNSPQWAQGKTKTANFSGSQQQANNQNQYRPKIQPPQTGYTGEEEIDPSIARSGRKSQVSIIWSPSQIVPTHSARTGTAPDPGHLSSGPPPPSSGGLGGVVDNQGDTLNLNF